MSKKALMMLIHMRKQIFGQPAPYVQVRGAALSIGVDPIGSECEDLVDELLWAGYIQHYPSPSLTAHGLYRLTDSGIAAAEADSSGPPGSLGRSEGRSIMQERIERNALQLLHAIRVHHPDIYAGAWVNPHTAALEAGVDPDSAHYRVAMEYLEAEDALERAEESSELEGSPLYTVTLRGMQMLPEA
jgi:hypothetical protein